jgi:hypothetical protein
MDDAQRDLAKRVEQLTFEEEELKKEDKRREEAGLRPTDKSEWTRQWNEVVELKKLEDSKTAD